MSAKITWGYDSSINITQFRVEKSTDKGASFLSIATVPFNTSGANYDKIAKNFFYNDLVGNPGDIYRIFVDGALGTSLPVYVIVPSAFPPVCSIFGYVFTSDGSVDREVEIKIKPFHLGGGKWASNFSGITAHDPQAVGIVSSGPVSVYPDENGMWQVQLLQGIYVIVEISALEFEAAIQVPSTQGPVNICDINRLTGSDYGGIWGDQSGIPINPVRG